ncbi:hypothetical protein TWF281_009118 [Arthrobotrys megalospora]
MARLSSDLGDLIPRLSNLPPEVILLVIRQMIQQQDSQSISRLCRTSQEFRSYTQPLLYETVDIHLDIELGVDPLQSQALLHQGHTGLKYIKHFVVSGNFDGGSTSVIQPTLYGRLKDFQNQIILSILRNIPPDTLRSFIWSTDLEMSVYVMEQLCKYQQRLEGFWGPQHDEGDPDRLDLAELSLKGNFKHIHMVGIDRTPWFELLFQAVRMSAACLETLSLHPSRGLIEVLRENLMWGEPEYGESNQATVLAAYLNLDIASPELEPTSDLLFPSLRYLSLREFDESFLTEFPWLKKAINFTKLEVLKLKDCGGVPSLTSCLRSSQLHLKILHLVGSGDELQIRNILMSFDGLEELSLEHECEEVNHIALAINNHKNTLKSLYWNPTGPSEDNAPPDLAPDTKASWLHGLKILTELAAPPTFRKATQHQPQDDMVSIAP